MKRQKRGKKFSVIFKITRATMSKKNFLLEIIIGSEANDDDDEEEERKILCA
jgi:hypothetical protein